MKIIIVPLDGSELAGQVLPYVCGLAQSMGARIHLVRVQVEPMDALLVSRSLATSYGTIDLQEFRQAWNQQHQYVENYLATQALLLEEAGQTVTYEVGSGPAATAIVEIAATQHAELIAMATHARSGLRRWVLGSVADAVLHATVVPLVLVRGDETSD